MASIADDEAVASTGCYWRFETQLGKAFFSEVESGSVEQYDTGAGAAGAMVEDDGFGIFERAAGG